MTRYLIAIAFTTLGIAAPQITLVPGGYAANPDFGPLLFQVLTVSSSPNATVTLTLSDTSWFSFQTASSTGCTNLVSTLTVATTSTPKPISGCLSSIARRYAAFNVAVTASARGFAPVSVPVPISVFPNGNVQLSGSSSPLSLGEERKISVYADSTLSSIPFRSPTFNLTRSQILPTGTNWLKEEDDCPTTPVSAPAKIACTAKISIKQVDGLTPNATYAAGVQFMDNWGTQAVFPVRFTYSPPTVTSSALGFISLPPCRVVDTRVGSGPLGGPMMSGGSVRTFPVSGACGIPSAAQAYAFNVTVVPTGKLGYLTIWPSGQTQPVVSTLNSDRRIKANAAIVPAGSGGAVTVYVSDTTEVILDITGYFTPATDPAALAFYPLTPCRAVDTRPSSPYPLGKPTLAAGDTRNLQLLLAACPVVRTAQAYSLNITALPSGPVQFVTIWPTGQERPKEVSALNAVTGTTTANAAIVPGGTLGDVSVYATDATNVLVDINGYFAPYTAGGLWLYTLNPCRALETREPKDSPPISDQKDVSIVGSVCGVPAVAKAFALNATVVPPGELQWLTLWPSGVAKPEASTLNAYDGAVTSNMAIVPTSNGSVSAFVKDPSHLILDIFGYFAP